MSLIDLLNRTQATRAEIMELLRGTEELRQKLERENARLQIFADAVREIALKPIDASDAMDELDTLLSNSYFLANVEGQPTARTEPNPKPLT